MNADKMNPAIRLVFPRLDAFLGAMRAHRDLEDYVSETVRSDNAIEEDYVLQGKRLYPGMDPDIHRRAAGFLHSKIHERMNALREAREKEASADEIDGLIHDWAESLREGLREFTDDPGYYSKSAHIWRHVGSAPSKSRVLRNSLLMGAVSDFEVLVAGLVRAILSLRPEILRSSEKVYSFREVEPFSTIDEFRDHCAEGMAESLLRGGFEDWMEWFDKGLKIKVPGVTEDARALVEIFQRRHLLVHNGGVVNRFYLSKVPNQGGPQLGDRIAVGRKYLRTSLHELTTAGVMLAYSILIKLASDDDDRHFLSHRLDDVSFDLLMQGCWPVVARLNEWHLGFVKDAVVELPVKVNRWIALKRMGEAELVLREVQEWDTATLSGVYRLAKLALLDENDQAYTLAKSLLASGELDSDDWLDWPLLEGVRDYELINIEEGLRLRAVSFSDAHSTSPDDAVQPNEAEGSPSDG